MFLTPQTYGMYGVLLLTTHVSTLDGPITDSEDIRDSASQLAFDDVQS